MISVPLPCCYEWTTNPFLTHEKSVRTRCDKVPGTLQRWTGQEMTHKQDVCNKSTGGLQEAYKGV